MENFETVVSSLFGGGFCDLGRCFERLRTDLQSCGKWQAGAVEIGRLSTNSSLMVKEFGVLPARDERSKILFPELVHHIKHDPRSRGNDILSSAIPVET